MRCWRQVIAVFIIAFPIITVPACRPERVPQTTASAPSPTQAGSIPFRVIAQAAPLGDQPKEPRYAVTATAQDWEALQPYIPEPAFTAGKAPDPSTGELVVVLFLGVRGTSGYSIEINNIQILKDQCTILFKEVKPTADTITEPARTLPFLLIALPLNVFASQTRVTFVFQEMSEGNLYQQEIHLP